MDPSDKKEFTLVNSSHRILSGLGLMGLGIILTQFLLDNREQVTIRDTALIVIITFFFLTSLYCLFTWSKTQFTHGSKEFTQTSYHFGFIKKIKKGACNSVFFHQTPQLRPAYTLFLGIEDSDDIIIKEGLKRSQAQKIGDRIADICGLSPRAKEETPEETIVETSNKKHFLDDDYYDEEEDNDDEKTTT